MKYGSTRETTPIKLAILSARAAMELDNKRLGSKPGSYEYSEKLVHEVGLIKEQLAQGRINGKTESALMNASIRYFNLPVEKPGVSVQTVVDGVELLAQEANCFKEASGERLNTLNHNTSPLIEITYI